MLILIDGDLDRIYIYGDKGILETDINNKKDIINAIGSNNVYYVTSAVEVDAKDILGIIDAMNKQHNSTITPGVPGSGNYYLKSNVNGLLVIPDINAKGEDAKLPLMTFQNDLDCKPYDSEVVNKSFHLKSLIKSGQIKIINEVQYQKYAIAYNKKMEQTESQQNKLQSKIDQGLDSILVDAGIKAEDVATGYGSSGGMDITDNGPVSLEEQNENAALMKQLGGKFK